MSEDKVKQKEVRVIALIGGNWSETSNFDAVKDIMPENYLSESNLPTELIKDVIKNGWTDKKGNVYFEKSYQPKPVKHEVDENVYVVVNDQTPKEEMMFTLMPEAMRLLNPIGFNLINENNTDEKVVQDSLDRILD